MKMMSFSSSLTKPVLTAQEIKLRLPKIEVFSLSDINSQTCAPPLVSVVASSLPPLLPSFVSLSPSGSVDLGLGPLPLIASEWSVFMGC